MQLTQELVTPSVATEWLTRNTLNRKLRPGVVARYAEDLRQGAWDSDIVDPIVFSEDDDLMNGQHRLAAILQSGVSITMWVQRGVATATQFVMDTGLPRRLVDFERLTNTSGVVVTPAHIAAANQMLAGFVQRNSKTSSHTQMHAFFTLHHEAIDFAISLIRPRRRHDGVSTKGTKMLKGLSSAPVVAVFARAFYSVPLDQLREAAAVLQQGISTEPHHEPLIRHRDWLLLNGVAAQRRSGPTGWRHARRVRQQHPGSGGLRPR